MKRIFLQIELKDILIDKIIVHHMQSVEISKGYYLHINGPNGEPAIWSDHGDKWLKNSIHPSGYIQLAIYVNGVCKNIRLHKLVAQYFVPNPRNCKFVDHINGNRADCKTTNLQWVTRSENARNIPNKQTFPGAYKRPGKRWRSHIRIDGKILMLGSFDTREEASKKYQEYRKSIFSHLSNRFNSVEIDNVGSKYIENTDTKGVKLDNSDAYSITVDDSDTYSITVDDNDAYSITLDDSDAYSITVDDNDAYSITLDDSDVHTIKLDDVHPIKSENSDACLIKLNDSGIHPVIDISGAPTFVSTNSQPVKGYSNYVLHLNGPNDRPAVWSIHSNKWLKPMVDVTGYARVSLCHQGKLKSTHIHRLVAEHFIPNPKNLPLVDHINGNKSDYRLCNLRWATLSVNARNIKDRRPFPGAYKLKNKWQAHIHVNGKRIYLGIYSSKEEASKRYKEYRDAIFDKEIYQWNQI